MARITHVKRAQQRYETKPVLDEFGNQLETAVMVTRKVWNETKEEYELVTKQKETKRGRKVFMKVTEPDKDRPKPNYVCDSCRKEILPGTPYKHISPKSGPYGGRKLTRHESCPSWNVWDYSSSLSARLAQISHDFWEEVAGAESPDDVTSALENAASSIEELAQEKQDGADNIESGFGHETSQSEELRQVGDDLEAWAEEVRSADVPEIEDCTECTDGQKDCNDCEGTGADETTGENCTECDGNGTRDCDQCDGTGEDIATWRENVESEVTIVDEAPV